MLNTGNVSAYFTIKSVLSLFKIKFACPLLIENLELQLEV